MHVILTGATGFIGSAFLVAAQQRSMKIRSVLRSNEQAERYGDAKNSAVVVPEIAADTDWSEALVDVDVVVHCAARVHVMHDSASDPLAEFRKVNVVGTLNLAKLLAETDARMLKELTVSAYFKYTFMTVTVKGTGDRVRTK